MKLNKQKKNFSEYFSDNSKLFFPKGVFSFSVLKQKILEYKWIVSFFIIFLVLQLFQMAFIYWDKIAYVFGGKWFCGNQVYLELIRPPLPSFLNCVFWGNDFSIFLTTTLACFAYFAAILIIFSQNKKALNQFVFALFAFLFPAILFSSNFGSDLLALAFILLAFVVKSPLKKGFFFGLSSLSRYNFLLFGLVLLWEQRKNPKNILLLLLPFVLLWIPWMIFNYLYTGNPFFSIYESSYLNVAQKGIAAPFSFDQIVFILLFLVSFVLLGIKNSFSDSKNQAGLLSAIMFFFSGIKETRFMNLLSPVLAFNAAKLSKKNNFLFWFFILAFVVFLVIGPKPYFVSSFNIPQDSFIKDCRVASDKWVFFYDKGIVAECFWDVGPIDEYLSKGGNIVLYDYKGYDLNKYNVINRGDYVIIKSDSCSPQPKKYISGSLRNYVIKWLRDTNSIVYDYSDWVN